MKRACLILMMAMLAGCVTTTPQPKHLNAQEKTAKEWNAARAKIYYGLAKQQYKSGDLERSRETLDQALKLEPKDVQSLLLSSQLWIENGQLESAERILDQVRSIDPKNAEADYLSGIVYQRWQLPSRAFDYYSSASTKAPAELAYVLAKAEMLVTLERPAEALALLNSKAQYFEHSAALRDAIGQLLVDSGKYSDAIEMFRQASILSDDDPVIDERLGLAMYYAGEYRDAADVLSKLAATPAYATQTDLLMALGECNLHLSRYHDALDWFESATQAKPTSTSAWLRVAQAAMQLGDYRRADLATYKAISLDPSNSDAQIMLGYVRLRQHRLNDALDAFVKASDLDPHDAVSVTMAGYIYAESGMKKEAVECYSRALQLKPGDPFAEQLMRKMKG